MCGNSNDDRDCKDKDQILLQRHAGAVGGDNEDSHSLPRQSAPAQRLDRINSPKNSVTVL